IQQTSCLAGDTLQREFQKRREIVLGGSDSCKACEVAGFLVVVIVAHRDERRVAQSGALKHQGFQSARRATIPVEKRMHRGEMEMGANRLDQRIVLLELAVDSLDERTECVLARLAALDAPMFRVAKDHVRPIAPEFSRRTMVVIRARYDASMNLPNELAI